MERKNYTTLVLDWRTRARKCMENAEDWMDAHHVGERIHERTWHTPEIKRDATAEEREIIRRLVGAGISAMLEGAGIEETANGMEDAGRAVLKWTDEDGNQHWPNCYLAIYNPLTQWAHEADEEEI